MAYATAVCRQLEVPLQVVPLQGVPAGGGRVRPVRAARRPHAQPRCAVQPRHQVRGVRRPAGGGLRGGGQRPLRAPAPAARWPLPAPARVDPVKDQSYFLAYLRPDQLGRLCFPIGGLHKREVRAMASERQLAPSTRKDSQGICFLGKLTYRDFVRAHLGEQAARSGRRAPAPSWAATAGIGSHHRPASGPGPRQRSLVRGGQGRDSQHGIRRPRSRRRRAARRIPGGRQLDRAAARQQVARPAGAGAHPATGTPRARPHSPARRRTAAPGPCCASTPRSPVSPAASSRCCTAPPSPPSATAPRSCCARAWSPRTPPAPPRK